MPTIDERVRQVLIRAAEPVDRERSLRRIARRRDRRLVVRRVQISSLIVATLAGSAVGGLALVRSLGGLSDDRPATSPEPRVSPFALLPKGWSELPPPPEARSAAAVAWTGDRLLVWGGYVFTGYGDEQPQGDGFSFDARSRTWGPLPPGPLAARVAPATAWTGREMVVWGGRDPTGAGEPLGDGAAFTPSTGAWRMLPRAPLSARAPYSVWTSRELLVWGSSIREQRLRDGAAYDPASDSWRRIAEAPIELTDATAVWTGREMIVFGAALHGGNVPETEHAIGAAYDPERDTWRRLPDSELSPQASTAAWTGRELVAWDYEHVTAAYDPAQDRWRRLDGVPLDPMECGPEAVAAGDHVVGDFCGTTALYDPTRDRWRDISDPELLGWGFDLVSADPVALLVGRNLESGEEALLAYRPIA